MTLERNGPEDFEPDVLMEPDDERPGPGVDVTNTWAGERTYEPDAARTGRAARGRTPIVLSRRSAAWWMFGIGVLMIWVFTLGILVGRGTIFKNKTFQQIEKRLSPSEKELPPPVVEVTDPPASPDQKLTFYDNLSTSRQKPDPEKFKTPPPKIEPVEVAPPSDPPPSGNGTAMTDLSKAKAGAPAEAKKEPATPKPVSPGEEPGVRFTVQVAASDTMEQAEKMAQRLKQNGYDAYYYEVEVNGRRYVRVRVGRYSTREQAQAVMAELEAAGHSQMYIARITD